MSAFRLELKNKIKDSAGLVRKSKFVSNGYNVEDVKVADVYTINKDFTGEQKKAIAEALTNEVFEEYFIIESGDKAEVNFDFNFAIEVGFLPGVTDNIGNTVSETIEDLLKTKFDKPNEDVYSSQITFLKGELNEEEVEQIAEGLYNNLIQRAMIKSRDEFKKDGGMGITIPKVEITQEVKVDEVDLSVGDEQLIEIGKKGIKNSDGTYRGPLALGLSYMKAIQAYFAKEGRSPRDIELEALAQTWSEHCKHTIFADPMDEIEDGIYKHYIKRATKEIRANKGQRDFCVSVFKDNSGAIIFDDEYLVTDKAETHNSPSALDPFGGAITGIVGVNRDTLGFGKGAKPVINRYGFCVGNPQDKRKLYRGKDKENPTLSPRTILDGVVGGVEAGGNQSGIPAPQGFLYFDNSYRGKPLVFAGTVGLIPRKINGKPSDEKQAKPGDKIVMVGGRVGQDGIHGATFSSEALDSGSPATAVQIGDPITQKKLSDAIAKEARGLDLYSSITDCGAGGLGSSVGEMARESGGCKVYLDKVPLKYPNLAPWEIWISESQERMTLAIPPQNVDKFLNLMERRGVEATVIGEFTKEDRCQGFYNGDLVMDLEMDFLHDGLPICPQVTTYTKKKNEEPGFAFPSDFNNFVLSFLSRNNIASKEWVSVQYDHEVQAGSAVKPLHGKGRVNSVATATKPVLTSNKGVVTSQAMLPRYSEIDTYQMAACSIDNSVRNAVSVGANPDYLAIMDNFCWCSSDEPGRLGQLKEAARACYEVAVGYGTPFISGKDSMFNDFKGFDENDKPVKISILPTLLVSSLGVIDDVAKTVTLDAKKAGDLVYIIGKTEEELGGSEYFSSQGVIGNSVPKVDVKANLDRYRRYYKAVQQGIISSGISVEIGGLLTALAKTSIGGSLGVRIGLRGLATQQVRNDYLLFSETQGRFVVTVDPAKKKEFEALMVDAVQIGEVTNEDNFVIRGLQGDVIVDIPVAKMEASYKKTFLNY